MKTSLTLGILSKKHSNVDESNVGLMWFGSISSWEIIFIWLLLFIFNQSGTWLSVTIKMVPLCQGKYFLSERSE